MKRLFLILTVFFLLKTETSFAWVIRERLLPELIYYSDIIVLGTITSIQSSTYTLTVSQTIKGEPMASFVLKKDVRDLKPLYRWDKYKIGQTELAFLSYEETDKIWELTHAHGEAEVPVTKDSIYVYSRGWVLPKNAERYPNHKVTLDNCIFDALPFNKNELIQAIIDFSVQGKTLSRKLSREKDMIAIQKGTYPQKEDIILTNKKLIAFKDKSASHKRIICELMDEPYLRLF